MAGVIAGMDDPADAPWRLEVRFQSMAPFVASLYGLAVVLNACRCILGRGSRATIRQYDAVFKWRLFFFFYHLSTQFETSCSCHKFTQFAQCSQM